MSTRTHLLLMLALVTGCSPPSVGTVRIIGHGGLGEGAVLPMNSAAALQGGLEARLDGVELDVQLSADGVLIAYHAEDLAELTACSGLVNAHPWSALERCAVTGSDGSPHRLQRLDSLLPVLAERHPNTDLTLDAKLFAAGGWWTYLEAFSRAVADLHSVPELQGRFVVECQVTDFLDLMRRAAPSIPVFLYTTNATDGIEQAAAKGYTGITLRHDRITAEEVQAAQHRGLQVSLFGAGGWWSHRSALGKAPDRLQSDAPVRLRDMLTQRP